MDLERTYTGFETDTTTYRINVREMGEFVSNKGFTLSELGFEATGLFHVDDGTIRFVIPETGQTFRLGSAGSIRESHGINPDNLDGQKAHIKADVQYELVSTGGWMGFWSAELPAKTRKPRRISLEEIKLIEGSEK